MVALKEGNIEETVRFISTNQREFARNDWTMFDKYVSNLAENFSDLLHVTAFGEKHIVAQAMLPPAQGSFQCPLEVNFVLDTDGKWRVANF